VTDRARRALASFGLQRDREDVRHRPTVVELLKGRALEEVQLRGRQPKAVAVAGDAKPGRRCRHAGEDGQRGEGAKGNADRGAAEQPPGRVDGGDGRVHRITRP
jgi:hypothetical protein